MPEAGHPWLYQSEHLAGSFRRGVGGIDRDRRPLDRETRGGGEGSCGWKTLVDEQVNAAFTGAHERPAGARVAREDDRQAGEVDSITDGATQRVDYGKRYNPDTVLFVNHLGFAEIELGHHDLHTLRVDGSVPGSGVPGEGFLNPFNEMPRAKAGLGAAGTPHEDRPVCPTYLRPAARERDEVGRMVCVEVRQEHLVELVDRQLQARIVGQGAAADVENQEVTLCITDFDKDAGCGLATRYPGIAAAKHRHPHFTVLDHLLTRNEHVGVLPSRRTYNRCHGDRLRSTCKYRHRQGHGLRINRF